MLTTTSTSSSSNEPAGASSETACSTTGALKNLSEEDIRHLRSIVVEEEDIDCCGSLEHVTPEELVSEVDQEISAILGSSVTTCYQKYRALAGVFESLQQEFSESAEHLRCVNEHDRCGLLVSGSNDLGIYENDEELTERELVRQMDSGRRRVGTRNRSDQLKLTELLQSILELSGQPPSVWYGMMRYKELKNKADALHIIVEEWEEMLANPTLRHLRFLVQLHRRLCHLVLLT